MGATTVVIEPRTVAGAVLLALRRVGGWQGTSTLTALAQEFIESDSMVHAISVSTALRRLHQHGYVARGPSPENRRNALWNADATAKPTMPCCPTCGAPRWSKPQ